MKLITLIALLFTFNLQAQTLVTIIPNDSKLASMQLEEPTLNKAIKKLKKIVLRSSWLKGEWQKDQSGYIFDRDISPIGEDEKNTEYFIPSNFSVTIEDVTSDRDTEKAEKKAKKDEMKALKALKFDKNDSLEDRVKDLTKAVKRLLKEQRND